MKFFSTLAANVQAPAKRSTVSLLLWSSIALLVVTAGATDASAQAYPSRPITVVVPTSVGTVADILARLVSIHMSKALGQPMVVENLGAASGVPGTERMIKAAKDGYTIAVLSNNHAINPGFFKALPFDSLRDVVPIGVIGSTPLVLITNPALPANNLAELIALAKSKPGALNFGSNGNGSVLHLAGVLLNGEAGINVKHIPYSAFGQMVTDVIGGQLDMAFAGPASVAGHIESGKLRAIGVTTPVRSGILPNVPTFAASGLPNYSFDGWLLMAGPAGLPKPIVERLNAELRAALALKEVQETMAKQGVLVIGSTTEAASTFFQSEMNKHTQLIKRSGVGLAE